VGTQPAGAAPGDAAGGDAAPNGDEGARPDDVAAAPPGPEDRVSDERRKARRRDPDLAARFERYQEELGLPLDDADVLTGSLPVARFFEAALEEHGDPSAVAAWVVNDLMAELKERSLDELPFDGRALGRLVAMVENDRVSRRAAREVFATMVEEGADPADVVRERGLEKVDDPAVLEPVIDELLAARADKVREYREGKKGLLGFFIGQIMRRTGGSADPALVRNILESKLEDG
jgi:glutaminyl-tRNA synthetase